MNTTTSLLAVLGMTSTVLSGCASVSTGEYSAVWSKADPPRTLQLSNGFTIRYVRSGDGPPLILMHTIRTQLDYFEKLVPVLKEHYQVFALDLPGHGQSTILPVEYTEKLFRDSVTEFITQLDLHDVTLAGESIGGALALTVSSELPDRVRHAIALNPYDYGDKFGGGIRNSRNGWIIGLFNVFGAYTIEPEFVLTTVLKGGSHNPANLQPELLHEFYRTGLRPDYRRVEYSVFKNWQTWIEARRVYPRIATPVTLVYSDNDWSTPEDREQTRRALRDPEFLTIRDAGHFGSLDKPDEVANIILSHGVKAK